MNIAVIALFAILFVVANILAYSAHRQEPAPPLAARGRLLPAVPVDTAADQPNASTQRPPETIVKPMVPRRPHPLPSAPQERPAA